MFKKIVLIFILFTSSSLMFGQDKIADTSIYAAIYKFTYQQDSTNIKSKRAEKMVLLIGKKYSLFQSENNRFNDSLFNKLSKNYKNNAQLAVDRALTSRKRTRFKYKIIKTPNNILVFNKIVTDKFIYEENTKLKWNIEKETKQINNYLCQRAVTSYAGRNYIAWFTNEIPINDGPYKFRGLPGLIIKIYDTKMQYIFELLSFEKYSTNFEVELKKAQKVSKKEYFKAYNNFKNNIVAQLEIRGIYLDKAGAANAKMRVKKTMNNQIELSIK